MTILIVLLSTFAVMIAASRHPRLKGRYSMGQAAGYALAIMLFFTATAHFNSMRGDLVKMVPSLFPVPGLIVTVTGILEYLGALGLLVSSMRKYVGFALAVMFVAMFPANIYAALNGLSLRGEPVTPLLYRIPMQILFIGFAVWAARTKREPPITDNRGVSGGST